MSGMEREEAAVLCEGGRMERADEPWIPGLAATCVARVHSALRQGGVDDVFQDGFAAWGRFRGICFGVPHTISLRATFSPTTYPPTNHNPERKHGVFRPRRRKTRTARPDPSFGLYCIVHHHLCAVNTDWVKRNRGDRDFDFILRPWLPPPPCRFTGWGTREQ